MQHLMLQMTHHLHHAKWLLQGLCCSDSVSMDSPTGAAMLCRRAGACSGGALSAAAHHCV